MINITEVARRASPLKRILWRAASLVATHALASKNIAAKVGATFVALIVPAMLAITGNVWLIAGGGLIVAIIVVAMADRALRD